MLRKNYKRLVQTGCGLIMLLLVLKKGVHLMSIVNLSGDRGSSTLLIMNKLRNIKYSFLAITVIVCSMYSYLLYTGHDFSFINYVTYDRNHLMSTMPSDGIYSFIDSPELPLLRTPTPHVSECSCSVLFDQDVNENVTRDFYNVTVKRISNTQYQHMVNDCEQFKHHRGYIYSPITEMEQSFPLAYSIIAYKEVERIERLLRAIYRPQNIYCIHMDGKSTQDDIETITYIASCFENVFMPIQSINVTWGKFSVLEAELVCMKELYTKNKNWKYFINLTGQEFPLKTNLEIVRVLHTMRGANLVDGTKLRFPGHRLKSAKTPPPPGIRLIKGPVHIAVNRDFVRFVLYDQQSKRLLQWFKNNSIGIPDELFFPTLNHNPGLKIPGSFLGDAEEYPQKPSITRYKNWRVGHGIWARPCSGKVVRGVCVLGVGDLPRLKNDVALFANKFHYDYQPLAYDCLEELIFNRTRDQYLHQIPIDMSYYSNLDQVLLQYKNDTN